MAKRKIDKAAYARFWAHDPEQGQRILDFGKKDRAERKAFKSAKAEINRLKKVEEAHSLNQLRQAERDHEAYFSDDAYYERMGSSGTNTKSQDRLAKRHTQAFNAARKLIRQKQEKMRAAGMKVEDTTSESVLSVAAPQMQKRPLSNRERLERAWNPQKFKRTHREENEMDDNEFLWEGGPTKKHFQQTADLIKQIPDEAKRRELAAHHAENYAKQNPRFDRKRFYAAVGVQEEAPMTFGDLVIQEDLEGIYNLMNEKVAALFAPPEEETDEEEVEDGEESAEDDKKAS